LLKARSQANPESLGVSEILLDDGGDAREVHVRPELLDVDPDGGQEPPNLVELDLDLLPVTRSSGQRETGSTPEILNFPLVLETGSRSMDLSFSSAGSLMGNRPGLN
jgi:hypothetical protein